MCKFSSNIFFCNFSKLQKNNFKYCEFICFLLEDLMPCYLHLIDPNNNSLIWFKILLHFHQVTYKSKNREDVSFQIEEKLLLKIDFSFVFLNAFRVSLSSNHRAFTFPYMDWRTKYHMVWCHPSRVKLHQVIWY